MQKISEKIVDKNCRRLVKNLWMKSCFPKCSEKLWKKLRKNVQKIVQKNVDKNCRKIVKNCGKKIAEFFFVKVDSHSMRVYTTVEKKFPTISSWFFPQFFDNYFKKIFLYNLFSKNFRKLFSHFFFQIRSTHFPKFVLKFFTHFFFSNFYTIYSNFANLFQNWPH